MRPSKNVRPGRVATASRVHFQALDGLRGLALLAVCLFHFHFVFYEGPGRAERFLFEALNFGWAGVDLFFALSGFLITGILLDSRESSSFFQTFYIRRALRIFPLYFLFVAVMVGLVQGIVRPGHWPPVGWQWYVFYLANWKANHTFGDTHVAHFWSLCIEEQFYFVWPMAVFVLGPRRLASFCVALAAVALALRLALPSLGVGYEAIYRGTFTHLDGLVFGALVAVGMRDELIGRMIRRSSRILMAASLLVVCALIVRYRSLDTPIVTGVGGSVIAVAFALLVRKSVISPPGFLSAAPLQSIGRVSYGMYVLHELLNPSIAPKLVRFLAAEPEPIRVTGKLLYIPLMIGITYLAAYVSFRFFEWPINQLKDSFPYRD